MSWLSKAFGNKTGGHIGNVLTGKWITGNLIPDNVLDPSGTVLSVPEPVIETVDPAQELAAAENKSAATSNAKAAARRRSQASGSLLSTGARGVTAPAQTQSILAYGKDKLGQ